MKHENFQCDCGYPVILFFLLVLFVCCTNVEKPYLELISNCLLLLQAQLKDPS